MSLARFSFAYYIQFRIRLK